MAYELVTLKSGLKSLRLIENQETFHPGIGPVAEAQTLHIRQQRLPERAARYAKFIIWDVGLGAAANSIAAIEALSSSPTKIEIHSFDQTTEALRFAIQHTHDLQYLAKFQESLTQLITEKTTRLRPNITWHLHKGDFREQMQRSEIPSPHAIFYDPYSPSSNIEMWSLEHFKNLRSRLDDNVPCLITNYTRSTIVRVTWLLANFFVGVGCTIGEKEETSIATNDFTLLESPLKPHWLERVKISHSSAPLRGNMFAIAPISQDDFSELRRAPQFQSSFTVSC